MVSMSSVWRLGEEESALQNLSDPPYAVTAHGATDFGATNPQFANPYADLNIAATERFDQIRSALEDTKSIAVDILSGEDKITMLVAAPSLAKTKKYQYAQSNKRRETVYAAGKAALLSANGQATNTPAVAQTAPATSIQHGHDYDDDDDDGREQNDSEEDSEQNGDEDES